MSNIDKQIKQLDKELHNASMGAPDKWMKAVLLHAPQAINALIEENGELCEKIECLEAQEAQHRQAVEDGRWVELPEWPITVIEQIGRYRIVAADSAAKTITLEDCGANESAIEEGTE